jgi:alpha-tubulin suppressor-like RCC1 family protein
MKIDINTIGYRWRGIYSQNIAYIDQDVVTQNGHAKVWRNGGLEDFAPGQQDALLYGQVLKGGGGVAGSWGQVLTVDSTGNLVFRYDQDRNGTIATAIINTDNFTGAYYGSSLRWMAASMAEGDVRVWGRNNSGTLGFGRSDDVSYSQPKTYGLPQGTPPIAKLYANYDQSYFLDTAGGLWTAGPNSDNCSGTGAVRYIPTKINGFGDLSSSAIVTKVFTGQDQNGGRTQGCIDSTGKVYMWGNNTLGLMGLGDATARTNPTLIPFTATTPIKDAYCSSGTYPNSWLIDTNGQLWVAGSGYAGGLGADQNRHKLFAPWGTYDTVRRVRHSEGVYDPAPDPNYNGTQIIMDNGQLYMWGNNAEQVGGAWGNGVGTAVWSDSLSFPINATPAGKSVVDCYSLRNGYSRTIALLSDGTVWGTGYSTGNSQGFLGTNADRTNWAQIGAGYLENVTKIDVKGTSSTGFAMALRSDGKAVGWGWSNHGADGGGQYQIASPQYPNKFVALSNKTIIDFAISGAAVDGDIQMSTTFLCSDGTVWVTGYGSNGMNGASYDSDRGTPIQIIF